MHPSQTYPSDLTDLGWKRLEPLIPKPKSGGRPIEHPRRTILNAIFSLNRTGCQWSMLPKDVPPKSTVFDDFCAGRRNGLWEKLNDGLRVKVRVAAGPQALAERGHPRQPARQRGRAGWPNGGLRCGQEDRRTQAPSAPRHPRHD